MRALQSRFSKVLRRLSTPARYSGPSFAFDIDGVLLRGRKPLKAGRAALHLLYDHGSNAWRAPVAFLTNGGGHTESQRAAFLSEQFDVPVHESQVVLAHTPMREYVDRYNAMPDHNIVTVGPPPCAEVARSYGFQRVIAVERLAQSSKVATPFTTFSHSPELTRSEEDVAILSTAAIFVMADSRDWGRDIQILVDILASDGTVQRIPSAKQVVDLYFSNPDITFPGEYHLPRLAGGSFRVALEAVFARFTNGRGLRSVQYGKPFAANYQLAEDALRTQAQRLGFCGSSHPHSIFAVGDNPHSDIQGANNRGGPWISVLVRTGNFNGAENDAEHPADIVMDNVHDAVQHALAQ